jgi:hypothetical protein
MASQPEERISAAEVALQIARALDARNIDYAIGGAIALGFWGEPRGTMDVDIVVFVPKERPTELVRLLQEIDCDVVASKAIASLQQHGFCYAFFRSVRVDAFVPTTPFYESAKARRRRADLGGQEVSVFDAESLAVFKMMFFRPQDVLDVQKMVRIQASAFDRDWVRQQLADMFGPRDPRLLRWDELCSETNS